MVLNSQNLLHKNIRKGKITWNENRIDGAALLSFDIDHELILLQYFMRYIMDYWVICCYDFLYG